MCDLRYIRKLHQQPTIMRENMSSHRRYSVGLIMVLSACEPTAPVVEQATPNIIAISYDAYGSTPTLTPTALDLAIEHCKKQNLYANYRGVTVPSALTAKEVHTFVCERVKTDDNAVIIAQNNQYAAQASQAAEAVDAFFDGYDAARPTRTQCNTIGFQTNCTSY